MPGSSESVFIQFQLIGRDLQQCLNDELLNRWIDEEMSEILISNDLRFSGIDNAAIILYIKIMTSKVYLTRLFGCNEADRSIRTAFGQHSDSNSGLVFLLSNNGYLLDS